MKSMQLSVAALTTLLISSALWSCNKDGTSSESELTAAQQQQGSQAMPGRMPGTGGKMMDQLRAGCPMVVKGADVTVADTEKGVALTFTTDAGDVVDLRTRVRNMAKMYDTHRGHMGMMWHRMRGAGMGQGGRGMGGEDMMGGQGGGGMGGVKMGGQGGRGMGGEGMGQGGRGMGGEGMGQMAGQSPMPETSDTVTDTDQGARLELRPTDSSQLDALRKHVRRHQERMQSGECWMTQGQPAKTPQGQQEQGEQGEQG